MYFLNELLGDIGDGIKRSLKHFRRRRLTISHPRIVRGNHMKARIERRDEVLRDGAYVPDPVQSSTASENKFRRHGQTGSSNQLNLSGYY